MQPVIVLLPFMIADNEKLKNSAGKLAVEETRRNMYTTVPGKINCLCQFILSDSRTVFLLHTGSYELTMPGINL